MSPAECLEIGCGLTTALAHLHEHGLVHRDIKPSNILFVGGVPKLGDIGLVADVGDTRSIVGTEGYLASEGPGTPAADIYSLGKVLYEISTGMDRREFPTLPDLRGRITDAIIDSLAVIEGVRRSPRKSGWINLNEDDLRHALAKTNDLRHILTGRLAQVDDTVSLTLKLYPRGRDQPVWTESFAGGTNAIVELERRAVGRLAAKLGLKIRETEQEQIDRLLTNNLEALDWFRRAWAIYEEGGSRIICGAA